TEEQKGVHFEISDLRDLLIGFSNRAYEDLSDELFDRIATYNIGIPVGDTSTVIGQVRRKVYDNEDGTYTVLDVFGVKGVVAPGASLDVAGLPLYAAIGAEHGYDFVNIRQYDNKLKIGYAPSVMLPNDPWYLDLWHGAMSRWFGAKYIYDVVNGTFNAAFNFFRSPSDEFSARYQDIFNVIQTPFHLPLSVHEFARMEPGEIISYTLMGGIFLPTGVGWERSIFASNIGLNLYKRGAVRITILKEKNGNFAKIRLSNLSTQGYLIGGKIKGNVDVVEGVFFGSDLSVSLVPFRIEVGSSDIKLFDATYEYDMRASEGIAAYESAVLGDFRTSPLYTKDTRTQRNEFNLNYNLIIWHHQKSFQLDNSLVTIRDGEGINHVFKSMSHNEIKTGNVFHGRDESMDYFVDTTLEMDDPVNTKESKDPVVQIAFFITDRHAYGYQLREYFQMTEHILQDPQFFDEGQYDLEKDYEKMSLQLEIRFYLGAVDHILNTTDDELWLALAKAFGVDSTEWDSAQKRLRWINKWTYLSGLFRVRSSIEKIRIMQDAHEMVSYFQKIKNEPDRKIRASLLSEFHHQSAFQWRLLTVMLLLAPKEHIYYELHTQGKHIPKIDQSWGAPVEIERPDLHEKDDREMEGRPVLIRAHISEIKISYDEALAQARLQFKTDVDPRTIEGFYFKAYKIKGRWFRNEKLYETPNDRELFKEFSTDSQGNVTVWIEKLALRQKPEVGTRYEIAFAFRQNNQIFSVEPKFIFTFSRQDSMDIQWMNLEGKSEMK
ncbi:MAG: hypothetical protein HYY61_00235, partial [Deltaproteobacteria bacterium]|nr:hypothetical protein [Deltaproteobacteria bacterium]